MAGGVGGGAEDFSLTFLENPARQSGSTSETFSGVSFGAAHSGRVIAVAGMFSGGSGGTQSLTSVTIGGVTATVYSAMRDGGEDHGAFIALAAVPTGTTGDVVVTCSRTLTECEISTYALRGKSGSVAVYDSDAQAQSGTTTFTTTLDIPTGGALLSVQGTNDNHPFTSVSGTAGLSTTDASTDTGLAIYACGSTESPTAGTGKTVVFNHPAGTCAGASVSVSFEP